MCICVHEMGPPPGDGQKGKQPVATRVSKSGNPKRKHLSIEKTRYTCFETFAIIVSFILVIITFPFSLFICFKVMFEYKRMVIFRLGKLRSGGAQGPGLVFILPCVDESFIVDLRLKTVNVYPQQLITKDSVSIQVELVVFYRLTDPLRGIILVENYANSTLLLAQTTLRTIVGRKTLFEVIYERETIMISMREILKQGTGPWGVVIERVEIKDMQIPYEMQKTFATEAEANRRARAKFIAAQGEKTAAVELLVAAQILSPRPAAIQLRYFQTLCSIAHETNATYVIPLPKHVVNSLILAARSRLKNSKIRHSITQ